MCRIDNVEVVPLMSGPGLLAPVRVVGEAFDCEAGRVLVSVRCPGQTVSHPGGVSGSFSSVEVDVLQKRLQPSST